MKAKNMLAQPLHDSVVKIHPAMPGMEIGRVQLQKWKSNQCACPMIKDLIRYQATHDPQTELANLDFLIERLDHELNSGQNCHLVVLMITGINDIGEVHGVAAGLYVLQTIALRLRQSIGKYGYAARMQGGLFAAVSFDAAPEEFAKRLWHEMNQPILWKTEHLQLVVAAGVVNGHEHAGTAESMLQAGYAAAKVGQSQNVRGGISLFTHELKRQIEQQYLMETRLRQAITGHGLSLVMQPKICAASGQILGAEALVRWHDEQLGSVPPAKFIPLAERNGSITKITRWVMREALLEAAKWQQAGLDLSVAVNVSAIDLRNPELIKNINAALHSSGCAPASLVIELTESAVAEDPVQAIQQLQALKAMGLRISLDDFGTGYSSLSYLRRFPIDTLKIDRSFVTDIPYDSDAVAIVHSIVALAKALAMQTVAEGVETKAQAEFLREIGVDVLQGYLFSPPVSCENFLAAVMITSMD